MATIRFVVVTCALVAGLAHMAFAEIGGEVIGAFNRLTGEYALMSAPDGKTFTQVSCGGDLTHEGTPRYFIRAVPGSVTMPDGFLNSTLVASDVECEANLVLAGQPSNMRFSTVPRWSPGGSRVAFYAQTFDLEAGVEAESGVFFADVVYDGAGRPTGVENVALEISMPGETQISWSGDGSRIAFVGWAPDGDGGQQKDVFVYLVGSGFSYNLTDTPESNEDHPSWSPADERVAFMRMISIRGGYRYDVFTLSSPGGVAVQVTGKKTTGRPQNIFPHFSPDGQQIVFSSGDSWYRSDLYRIRSDGSGKAVSLTAKRDGDFRASFWRR